MDLSKRTCGLLAGFALLFCVLLLGPDVLGQEQPDRGKVEALMAIQLLSFTEWRSAEASSENEVKVIGVFEDEKALKYFQDLVTEGTYSGRYEVRPVSLEAEGQALDELDVLFFSGWNQSDVGAMIRKVGSRSVLLMGSFEGFLDFGGMVNFVERQKRLRFEVNTARARERQIVFRAKLLRLAERVIDR